VKKPLYRGSQLV